MVWEGGGLVWGPIRANVAISQAQRLTACEHIDVSPVDVMGSEELTWGEKVSLMIWLEGFFISPSVSRQDV